MAGQDEMTWRPTAGAAGAPQEIQGADPGNPGTPRLAGTEIGADGKVVAQKPMTYTQLYAAFNRDKPETDEERAAREKREKREKNLAALGDGLSAMANLFFASRGAPNMLDASRGLSAKTNERLERLRREREANERAWYEGYARARGMDEQKEQADRTWRHTLEREKIADARYEKEQKQKQKLAALDEKLKTHQITAAQYKAEEERIKALYAPLQQEADLGYKQAGINQRNAAAGASKASATASYARADYYNNGGAGGKGPTLQLEDDEPLHFGNDKDYDRTVMRLAPEYGVPTTTVEVTERNYKGDPVKQRTVKRDVKDIAADIEREAARRKQAANTGAGNGGKGTEAHDFDPADYRRGDASADPRPPLN